MSAPHDDYVTMRTRQDEAAARLGALMKEQAARRRSHEDDLAGYRALCDDAIASCEHELEEKVEAESKVLERMKARTPPKPAVIPEPHRQAYFDAATHAQREYEKLTGGWLFAPYIVILFASFHLWAHWLWRIDPEAQLGEGYVGVGWLVLAWFCAPLLHTRWLENDGCDFTWFMLVVALPGSVQRIAMGLLLAVAEWPFRLARASRSFEPRQAHANDVATDEAAERHAEEEVCAARLRDLQQRLVHLRMYAIRKGIGAAGIEACHTCQE